VVVHPSHSQDHDNASPLPPRRQRWPWWPSVSSCSPTGRRSWLVSEPLRLRPRLWPRALGPRGGRRRTPNRDDQARWRAWGGL